ncbi:uncharacterized protein LOC128957995 [Oppia nitens]|uniref:uncharacterized protein LOC128957995 n=1 Tax=Oppia nitens TaxID=1686743 RepID=UPI0023DC5C9D|nr:uncharacterized protein LOC128957995 [Oppia nitens]XP_054159783.1 uncharacterized protein LOC128957995 [Oppia nitens]
MDDESLRHNVVMLLLDILTASGEQPVTLKELVSKLGLYSEYSTVSRGLRRITGRGVDGLPGILVFLWQYPSIFTVASGMVSMTAASDLYADSDADDDRRSHQRIAVAIDFYEFQLRRLGAYLVPLQRLYDMRSQAANAVRSVCAQSLDQLTEFLRSHSDRFSITEDGCVALSEHLKRAAINGHTITRIDAPIELDTEVYRNTRIIVNTYHGKQIVDQIFSMADVVTVDLEGVNLGSVRGTVTLIQLAYLPKHLMTAATAVDLNNGGDSSGIGGKVYPQIFIFDVWSNPNLVDYCLKRLLESNSIKKVFHGCEDDSYALHRDFGVVLNNFIDTQAVHTVISSSTEISKDMVVSGGGGGSCGQQSSSEAIGLNGLFELYGGYGCNPLKAVVKKRYVGNSNYWCSRPLTEEMIYYAAYDVYVLLGIYLKMLSYMAQISGPNEKYLEELNRKAAFNRIWSEQHHNHQQQHNHHQRRQQQEQQQDSHYYSKPTTGSHHQNNHYNQYRSPPQQQQRRQPFQPRKQYNNNYNYNNTSSSNSNSSNHYNSSSNYNNKFNNKSTGSYHHYQHNGRGGYNNNNNSYDNNYYSNNYNNNKNDGKYYRSKEVDDTAAGQVVSTATAADSRLPRGGANTTTTTDMSSSSSSSSPRNNYMSSTTTSTSSSTAVAGAAITRGDDSRKSWTPRSESNNTSRRSYDDSQQQHNNSHRSDTNWRSLPKQQHHKQHY